MDNKHLKHVVSPSSGPDLDHDGATTTSSVPRWLGITAAVLFLGFAGTSRADDEKPAPPRIPVMEIGIVSPVSYRAKGFPEAKDPANATSFGLAMRIEDGLLSHLIPALLGVHRLLLGEYLALDFGMTNSGDLTGRFAFGGQATYEINDDVGVGFRAYLMTLAEDLLPGNFGSHWDNFIVGEISGRYRSVIGRVRFDLGTGSNSGSDVSDLGMSVRFPTPWTIMGQSGWQIGLDYDRIDTKDSPGTTDGYVIHRFGGVFALAF